MHKSKKLLLFAFLLGVLVCPVQAQDAKNLISQHLNNSNFEKGVGEFVVLRDVVSPTSNVRHIYFQQTLGGIPVMGTESSLHFSKDGKLLKSNNSFLKEGLEQSPRSLKSMVAPEDALKGIMKEMGYVSMAPFSEIEWQTASKNDYEVYYKHPSLFEREISLSLNYVVWEGKTVPIWRANFFEKNYEYYWDAWFHATEGRLLKTEDLITYCSFGNEEEDLNYHNNLYDIPDYSTSERNSEAICENCYEVFTLPTESPLHGNRAVAEYPHNPLASPFGWHDTDGVAGHDLETTSGNNVIAIEAGDRYGYQAYGGSSLDFSGFPFSIEYSQSNQSEDASITNAFYTANIAHDVFYTFGFDESATNFQNYNYTDQGLGKDPVEIQVQSMIRPCNAFMVTPRDGRSPTLVLNTCNDRDGSFDNLVVIHEYGHGVSSRMTIGDGNLLYKESPTEGWSDWFGLMLTMQEEDTAFTNRTIATYLRGQSANGSGIREYPYTVDTELNPLVFESLEEGMGIHEVGTVWATILWDMTWRLIDVYGYDSDLYSFTGDVNEDAGNTMAMAIVVEGLRYTTSLSGLVGARDGIVIAAQSIYGPEVQCLVWEAFTSRGLGVLADSGSTIVLGDEAPSYDFSELEPRFDLSLVGLCSSSAELNFISGGFPAGGVYSGPGVTDKGNGIHFSFDPAVAGIGEHEITYSLAETPCFPAFEATRLVEVGEDTEPPRMNCIEDNTQSYIAMYGFELPDYTEEVFIQDDCSGFVMERITQKPKAGTLLSKGIVEVTIEAEDPAGNISSCSFNLSLIEINDFGGFQFGVIPNPAVSHVTIDNPSLIHIDEYHVWNLLGEKVISEKINAKQGAITIPMETLQQGMYFLSIDFENTRETFRIIKN